jgi:hypothetical protein
LAGGADLLGHGRTFSGFFQQRPELLLLRLKKKTVGKDLKFSSWCSSYEQGKGLFTRKRQFLSCDTDSIVPYFGFKVAYDVIRNQNRF